MEYGEHDLADGVRTELEASYVKHGCGPEFWSTYHLHHVLPLRQLAGIDRKRKLSYYFDKTD